MREHYFGATNRAEVKTLGEKQMSVVVVTAGGVRSRDSEHREDNQMIETEDGMDPQRG